jgi:hypothetical protein
LSKTRLPLTPPKALERDIPHDVPAWPHAGGAPHNIEIFSKVVDEFEANPTSPKKERQPYLKVNIDKEALRHRKTEQAGQSSSSAKITDVYQHLFINITEQETPGGEKQHFLSHFHAPPKRQTKVRSPKVTLKEWRQLKESLVHKGSDGRFKFVYDKDRPKLGSELGSEQSLDPDAWRPQSDEPSGKSGHVESGVAVDFPKYAASLADLPSVRGPTGWNPYRPAPHTALVIWPGGGKTPTGLVSTLDHTMRESMEMAWQQLRELGWELTFVDNAPRYDRAQHLPWHQVYPPGWKQGRPSLAHNDGKNLATLADDVVVPKIQEMVANGSGPAAVIAVSPGGQITLPRLWQVGWRGPSICINAGCVKITGIPGAPVRLAMVSPGPELFASASWRSMLDLRKTDVHQPVLLYHDAIDGDHPGSLSKVIGPLLDALSTQKSFEKLAGEAAHLTRSGTTSRKPLIAL